MPHCLFLIAAIYLVAFEANAADTKYSVKAIKSPLPAKASPAVAALLTEECLKVEDGNQATVCSFWFRKEIPAKATVEQIKNGLTYREIAPTTLIGVIHLPQPWIDFRKQQIPAGVYTLRLGFQPVDGDHMGTAPIPSSACSAPPIKI